MSIAETRTLLAKIRQRGYWQVVIRPIHFVVDRVPDRSDLYPLIRKCSVRFRVWDYPHVEPEERGTIGPDWVGQEFEWDNNIEVWRFHQTGQFFHLLALEEDWRDQSTFNPADNDWKPMTTLWELDSLFQMTSIFEFAARLAQSKIGDDGLKVEITLAQLQGRQMKDEQTKRVQGTYQPLECGPDCTQTFTLSQIQAMTEPRELALSAARHVYRHFGRDYSEWLLREFQREFAH